MPDVPTLLSALARLAEIERGEAKTLTQDEAALILDALRPRAKEPPLVFQTGCHVCGLGADGKPMGYVCHRNDCPTRVS